MTDTEKQDRAEIEAYLVSTFSRVVDEYGQQLDITLALPTLVELIKNGGQDDSDKKYTFIGESACQFAVRCILAKQYTKYDDRILDALAKKFRVFSQLNKIIWKDINLKKQIKQTLEQGIIQTMSGVLYLFYGPPAVENFIKNAVIQIVAVELGEATATASSQNSGPIQKFHILIQNGGGSIKSIASETPSKQWQVQITAKLQKSSVIFSHTRIAQSKQKARSAICQDIINYLEKHPEFLKQLKHHVESTEVHPLPISEQDYSVSTESNTIYPSTLNSESDPNNVHISIGHDEDAVRQLSRLLLGCDSDNDEELIESPTRKRSRGVNEMFSSSSSESMDTVENNIVKNEVKMETVQVKVEQEEESNMEILHSAPTAESMIDSYNPFIGAEPTKEINPKIIKHFKEVFKNNRSPLAMALSMPGQSKSIFLSLVVQNNDKVACESETHQVGPPHGPVFSAKVILKSKRYGNVFITTEGVSRTKRNAECHAFHKLVTILK